MIPGRRNTPALQGKSVFDHYHVDRVFTERRLPVLDLFPLVGLAPARLKPWLESIAVLIIVLTYFPQLVVVLIKEPESVVYSRDAITLFLLSIVFSVRSRQFIFEAHTFPGSHFGRFIRRWLAPRIGGIVVITNHLRQRYESVGFPPECIVVAHDAIRAARFKIEGSRAEWRKKHGWPLGDFIVGYAGRFQTLGMDKGVGDLLEAVIDLAKDKTLRQVRLGLIGGPEQFVDEIRARVVSARLSADTVLYAGQVPAEQVPGYLKAFDVCAMPFPWTQHFAYYASPLKLFEYMASGGAIVATDLPSTREIIRDGENGLLAPPSDPPALAAALRRLRDDPALADRLAAVAHREVFAEHTWQQRASQIISFIERCLASDHNPA
jgi:glycosyltransferase involved in cell wall biosynthesis